MQTVAGSTAKQNIPSQLSYKTFHIAQTVIPARNSEFGFPPKQERPICAACRKVFSKLLLLLLLCCRCCNGCHSFGFYEASSAGRQRSRCPELIRSNDQVAQPIRRPLGLSSCGMSCWFTRVLIAFLPACLPSCLPAWARPTPTRRPHLAKADQGWPRLTKAGRGKKSTSCSLDKSCSIFSLSKCLGR